MHIAIDGKLQYTNYVMKNVKQLMQLMALHMSKGTLKNLPEKPNSFSFIASAEQLFISSLSFQFRQKFATFNR